MCKPCVDAIFDADYTNKINAGVVELVDALDSKPRDIKRQNQKLLQKQHFVCMVKVEFASALQAH
jgi:hypothetical protein